MSKRPIRDRGSAERRGPSSESWAALCVRLKAYRIRARGRKAGAGEIDLVAAAPFGPVCFIEVKARGQARSAAEAVGNIQQTRIARAASLYLASRPHLSRRGSRFDIVAIAPRAWPVHHRDV